MSEDVSHVRHSQYTTLHREWAFRYRQHAHLPIPSRIVVSLHEDDEKLEISGPGNFWILPVDVAKQLAEALTQACAAAEASREAIR